MATKEVKTEVEVKPQYQFSIKAEVNAKGYVQPSVHIFSDSLADAIDDARLALKTLVRKLQQDGFKVATDLPYQEKEKD